MVSNPVHPIMTGDLSRRHLLRAIGVVGVAAAMPLPALSKPLAAGDRGAVRSVVILGAGITGLVAARELEARGVPITVLEGNTRVGGRVWTVRGGDRFTDTDGVEQQVTFSPGLYQNAGAARLPSHHQGVLGLARELDVRLEPLVNSSRSAFLGDPAGQIRIRQAANDLRGHLSELLATALAKGTLDLELPEATRKALARFLTAYGDLDPSGRFRGTARSGLSRLPGAFDEVQQAVAPRTLDALLANPNLAAILYEEDITQQATMLAPTGGMDQIPKALAASLKTPVTINAVVKAIRRTAQGVRIEWSDAQGRLRASEASHAIITIPLAVLSRIDSDFSPAVKAALSGLVHPQSVKVAFESAPFWEQDQIYGGLSFVGGETQLIWYPSDRFQQARQVLLAAYASREAGRVFAARPIDQQVALARAAVEQVHPSHGRDLINPVVINWGKQPFARAPWIEWELDHNDPAAIRLLNQPDGPFRFAGSHLSQYSGHWQEGAVLSARRAVAALVPAHQPVAA